MKSDIGRYGIMPEWILEDVPNGAAIRLFAFLACRWADRDGVAYPSRATLAKALGSSLDTVDRAVRELVAASALTVQPQFDASGDRGSNIYTLNFAPPPGRTVAATRGGMGAATGGRTAAAHNQTQVEPDPSEPNAPAATAARREDADPDAERTGRAFRAYENACGSITPPVADAIGVLLDDGVTAEWFEAAAAEAALNNARTWRYMEACIQHWQQHGRACACRKGGTHAKPGRSDRQSGPNGATPAARRGRGSW